MKQITLVTMGTEGDVRPLVALGCVLRDNGYGVTVCAGPNYRSLCNKYRINFAPFGINMQEAAQTGQIGNNQQMVKGMSNFKAEALRQLDQLADLAKDAALLIGAGALLGGGTIAAYYGIPYRHVYHAPVVLPSRHYAPVFFPWQRLPQWGNGLLWGVNNFMLNRFLKPLINAGRERFGLKPIVNFMDFFYQDVIIAADPALAPIPPDVTNHYLRTGYWPLSDDQELDPALLQFIESGAAPIYIGFGSMTGLPPAKAEQLWAGLASSGYRFLVSQGWAGLGNSVAAPNIKVIEAAPHHKLFPKLAAVVHHGGAGTTHTAAAAGIPQIIVPHMMDQFYWGERVARLGLGTAPLKKSHLSSARLLAAIDAVLTNRDIPNRAAEFAKTLHAGDGLAEALDYISKILKLEKPNK